jgi:DNA-binding HxlR family transcriptional regulator
MYCTDMAAHTAPRTIPLAPADEESLEALQAAVGVLAAKWSVVVLARLATGTRRFNELLRQIDGVSRRMLSATLRQLERDGLVERHVYARVPARVGYELSPAGERLLAALAPLAGWGVEHREEVFAAREQFDRMQAWRSNREGMQARSRAGAPPASII